MDGYKEAEKFDKMIGKLLKAHSIEDDTKEWLRFTRTVATGLTVLVSSRPSTF